jgi:hypothetical protein
MKAPNARDRSDANVAGTLTNHRAVPGDSISGNPAIPPYHNSTEVAGSLSHGVDPCSAESVDGGGSVSADHQTVDKCATVKTHPHLMQAHQHSSVTHQDHKAVHGAEKCGPMQNSESATQPCSFNGGRMPATNNIVRSGVMLDKPTSSTGVTARVSKGGVAIGPAVANPNSTRFGSV